MAYTPEQINVVTEKIKTMGKDKAMDFIKKNAADIKANPELANAVTSIYAEAFTGVKTPPNTLTGGVSPVNSTTTNII